jgi:Zn-dependent alcohol dehydrogenase
MRSRAAVIHGVDQQWAIEEIDIEAPKAAEVLVQWKAAGLCHSDEHLVTGDMVPSDEIMEMMGGSIFPMIGGHEGAGIVVRTCATPAPARSPAG